ncbi:MAG: 4'-phosphopantetheinyl transferase superfamily protein [Flavobacterium sp.]
MIGNDVIDLTAANLESNWQRPGFLNKICTQQEQVVIESSKDPNQILWRLWSMKEAAYKIWNRETGIRIYNPKQFECSFDESVFGKVQYKNSTYYTQTNCEQDKIHTIAVTDFTLFTSVVAVARNQNIIKKGIFPYIKDLKMGLDIPVSVSHHGKYWEAVMLDLHHD